MLKRSQIEAKVLNRLAEDPSFRTRLVNNPRGTLEAEFKVALSPRVTITLHEDTPDTLHIVLPPEGEAITASTLAQVSGCDRHPQFRIHPAH